MGVGFRSWLVLQKLGGGKCGSCHFLEGNYQAKRRVERVKRMVAEVGLEKERLEMFNMSAAEGPVFAEVVREMTERIKELGPSPLKA